MAKKIEENGLGPKGYSMCAVPSPNMQAQLEVYLNFSEMKPAMADRLEMPDGITRTLITPDNVEYFTMREVALEMIRKSHIQGVSSISKTYVRQENKSSEWVIDTQGTNLQALLGMPGIDTTRTISDDMWENYRIFGIESARSFLIKEITKVLSFDGTYINPRHISLLVDGMCRSGSITSVNRDGIPREVGPIAKGMFEKAVDNFAHASAFAEHDGMKGVAASVMFGTLAEVGTGTVEIKNAEKLPARKATVIPRRA